MFLRPVVSPQQKDSIRRAIAMQMDGLKPWVTRSSKPNVIKSGLQNCHLTIWPSHGRYYNQTERIWKWQRPQIFGTCEDLFTQSFVIPYIIPMLENAGAVVYVPRERDWQVEEVLVDNDIHDSGYIEISNGEEWFECPRPGFSFHDGNYLDEENPFSAGTVRGVAISPKGSSYAVYTPSIKEEGKYAVYVSYQTVDGSVDDAEYTVVHKGVETLFHVNQRMGGSTWAYLGSFDFDANNPKFNYVKITNRSSAHHGIVTTDAVRFGGGKGNIERNGRLSYLPRAMEAARYWTQWAGAPYEVSHSKNGGDDYAEDINSRSLMSNWLSYGSPYNPVLPTDTITPDSAALANQTKVSYITKVNATLPNEYTGHVPIEMCLAVHSDAGWMSDKTSLVGSLAICTTDFNDRLLQNGMPRTQSFDLASQVLTTVVNDVKYRYGRWVRHDFFDRNYSETRVPAQTSMILETLSHQNFPDMKMGHDPDFKFWFSRAIYKAIVRNLAREHHRDAVIQPLAPTAPMAIVDDEGVAVLSWHPVIDSQESSAVPKSYNVYIGRDNQDFDNGTNIVSTSMTVKLVPNSLYRFRVTAVNDGGESFPTEEVVALYNPASAERVMIINGFHRLSSPTVIENDSLQGFDLDDDIGLSYGKTPVWCGRQKTFETSLGGRSLGFSNNDFMGRFVAGNDFNYSTTHAKAIAASGRASISSLSSYVIDNANNDTLSNNPTPGAILRGYDMVDLVLGNEKDDEHSLRHYKTFSVRMQDALMQYADEGGRIFASGSYLASDMLRDDERAFLDNVFHLRLDTIDVVKAPFASSRYTNMEELLYLGDHELSAYRMINDKHYASHKSDAFAPSEKASTVMTYNSGLSAAVLYKGDKTSSFAMGIPFECLRKYEDRDYLMAYVLQNLLGDHHVRKQLPSVDTESQNPSVDNKRKKKKTKKNKSHEDNN